MVQRSQKLGGVIMQKPGNELITNAIPITRHPVHNSFGSRPTHIVFHKAVDTLTPSPSDVKIFKTYECCRFTGRTAEGLAHYL